MAQPGETQAFLEENAKTTIYENHIEKEIAVPTPDGVVTDFLVSGSPSAVTELTSTAQAQFVDSSGDYFRKDVLVFFRKDNDDTVVNTNTNAITIVDGTITYATEPTTAQADKKIVS